MDIRRLSCFQHLQWHPDRQELGRFAAAMLIGFALLGGIQAWRGGPAMILWGVGVTLAVAALIPGLGRFAYLAVYIPVSIAGWIVSKVILFLLFALLFVPIGLLMRARGVDPLTLRWRDNLEVWRRYKAAPDASSYYRQF